MKLAWKHLFSRVFVVILICGLSPFVQAMTDAEINEQFNLGMAELESGDLAKAISIFEAILQERPEAGRVRAELALANFRALNFVAARSLANEILNSPNTPENVKITIRNLMEEMEKQSLPSVFTPYLSVGLMYDDNVNVGPSSSAIDVGGGTLTLDASSQPLEDFAVQVSGGVAHRYLFPNTVKAFGSDFAVAWQSQLSLFRNHYIEEDDFHLNVISASTGPSWLAARKWRFQIKAQADDIRIGDDAIAWYAGITPSVTRFLGSRTALTTSVLLQKREFKRSTNDDRDGFYWSGGVDIRHGFQTANTSVSVGLRYFSDNAETSRRSNDGKRLNLGVNVKPLDNTNVYARFTHTSYDYDGVEPVFGIARDETDKRYSIGANYTFGHGHGLLDQWQINAGYIRTEHDSNVSIFEYTRDRYQLSLSRSF